MTVIEPYAITTLSSRRCGIRLLKKVELIARVSHRSESKVTVNSWERFITSVVIKKGDWSVTEHVSVTVEAVVDRGITHEWVRHRLGAYTQESTRFVNYNKGEHVPKFIAPVGLKVENESYWLKSVSDSVNIYHKLVTEGESPEIARSVLPQSLASMLICTYNLRMWRHFFLMRTTKESHPQMLQVTVPLLQEFQRLIPILYDDIVPHERQVANLQKAC